MGSKGTVFVTGAGGYIGSHTVLFLLDSGYDVVAADNFANSVGSADGQSVALRRVEGLTGKTVAFHQCDILDEHSLDAVFRQHKIDAVIHFAAMKSVGESMAEPLMYYENNVGGTLKLIQVMSKHQVKHLVMSSTCCVYGNPRSLPITEEHPVGSVVSVYGRTKFIIEEMLKDASSADQSWNIVLLRYFNPVGAHESGLIGEDPTKEFSNLMPVIGEVALGKKPRISIFGMDYDTYDGTGVRDYIHVMDLSRGHLQALELLRSRHVGCKAYNLGTGKGHSVLELIQTFEECCGVQVPYEVVGRREGDVSCVYADCTLARKELGFEARHSLEDMCRPKEG